ncbi:MAG TPA: Rho termination factor N-terminal domain-containing protein, partial [Chloroflexota bacterium]|nr:Rho termination factor N-terminal domain-containing protein [Chloroflexota bacterium]
MTLSDLEQKPLTELQDVGRDIDLAGYSRMKKQELVCKLLQNYSESTGNVFSAGVLEIVEDGFGFLRQERLLPGPDDIYVSQSQIRRFGLRTGDLVSGQIRPPKDNEKYYGLLRVEAVNGQEPEIAKRRPHFESLVPIFPRERFILETDPKNLSTRLVDLVAPIGRGQRATIVSPPKAGKTMLQQAIARAIVQNYPDVHVMAV